MLFPFKTSSCSPILLIVTYLLPPPNCYSTNHWGIIAVSLSHNWLRQRCQGCTLDMHYTHAYTDTLKYMQAHTYVHTSASIHTHTYPHKHTHTHTNIHTNLKSDHAVICPEFTVSSPSDLNWLWCASPWQQWPTQGTDHEAAAEQSARSRAECWLTIVSERKKNTGSRDQHWNILITCVCACVCVCVCMCACVCVDEDVPTGKWRVKVLHKKQKV